MKKLIALLLLTCALVFGCAKEPTDTYDDGSQYTDSDDAALTTSEGALETTDATLSLSLPDCLDLFEEYQTRYSLSEIKQGESEIVCKNGDFTLAIGTNDNRKVKGVTQWIVSSDINAIYSTSIIAFAEPLAIYASKATGKEVTAQHIVDRIMEIDGVETTDGTIAKATQAYSENGIQYVLETSVYNLSEGKVLITFIFIANAVTADGTVIPDPEPAPACGHHFTEATCTDPKTCTLCGMTEGHKNDHQLISPTCTTPLTCSICGETVGDPLGHAWNEATCMTPATCFRCKITSGEALGHDIFVTKCKNCDYTDFSGIAKTYNHFWAYDSITGQDYDVQNVSINSDGVFSFTFKGNDYHLQLEQTDRRYQNTNMLIFNCYVDGIIEPDAVFMVNKDYSSPQLEWTVFDGCNLYIFAGS